MSNPSETPVTMQLPAGMAAPSIVYLPDSSTVRPDASGQISVAARLVPTLLGCGWQIVVAADTTHVP